MGEVFLSIVGHDLSFVDYDDPVADGLHFGKNVGGEDNGVPFSQRFDQIADLNDLLGVKTDGRLVQNQDLRISDQSLSQSHTLPITFGQVLDDPVADIGDADSGANVIQVCLHGLPCFFQMVAELQIGLHRHIQIQGRVFGKIADVLLRFDGVFQDVKSCDLCCAGGGGDVSGEDIHRRRFTSAVGP